MTTETFPPTKVHPEETFDILRDHANLQKFAARFVPDQKYPLTCYFNLLLELLK